MVADVTGTPDAWAICGGSRRESLLREDLLLDPRRNAWFRAVNGRSFALRDGGRVRARASVYFPPGSGTAQLGHAAADTKEAMIAVLDACCTAARAAGYTAIVGPQGALRSAPSGVGVSLDDLASFPRSLFAQHPQPDVARALVATGFTITATGSVWMAEHADLKVSGAEPDGTHGYTVRTMRWTSATQEMKLLADVMNRSFATRAMHEDIDGADIELLVRCLRPVINPRLTVLCMHGDIPVGAMIGLRDCALPSWCDRLPLALARSVIATLSRVQGMSCVYALGMRPEYVNGRAAKAMLHGVGRVLTGSRRVITTWIDHENPGSWLLAQRIGMRAAIRYDLYHRSL